MFSILAMHCVCKCASLCIANTTTFSRQKTLFDLLQCEMHAAFKHTAKKIYILFFNDISFCIKFFSRQKYRNKKFCPFSVCSVMEFYIVWPLF